MTAGHRLGRRAEPMSRIAALVCAVAAVLAASAAVGEDLARPDPIMTPGAVDPHVRLADICTGQTKERRHVSPATRAKVLRDYNVSDAASVGMELDHLIPLALGASDTL